MGKPCRGHVILDLCDIVAQELLRRGLGATGLILQRALDLFPAPSSKPGRAEANSVEAIRNGEYFRRGLDGGDQRFICDFIREPAELDLKTEYSQCCDYEDFLCLHRTDLGRELADLGDEVHDVAIEDGECNHVGDAVFDPTPGGRMRDAQFWKQIWVATFDDHLFKAVIVCAMHCISRNNS